MSRCKIDEHMYVRSVFSWDVEDKIEMHRYYQWCKHIGDMNKSGISDNPLPFTHKPLENKYI